MPIRGGRVQVNKDTGLVHEFVVFLFFTKQIIMKRAFVISLLALSFISGFGQGLLPNSDTLRKNALNVYMEANDYIRKEIPFVNYVRDIKYAGVYVISTEQATGSGGRKFTYFLVGQNENSGMRDTISFVTSPGETMDEIRKMEVITLQMGLMRYVAKTPLSRYMKISFSEQLDETVSTDKWDSWVFRALVSGRLSGQQTTKSSVLNLNLFANRVTESWKIMLRARYNYSVDRFNIKGDRITSENNSKFVNSLIVKSISDHWSVGGSVYLGSSSYNNIDISTRIMPGIEYDLFPYSESTRRQFRLLYSIGHNYVNYTDTTIYNKVMESRMQHSFSVSYEVLQKWGSIDIRMEYSNYLYDWTKNNLSLDGEIDLRLTKNLSVNFGGGASLIHDQLGLVKGGATTEQVLLRQKELATQYRYSTNFGFTFTFGSIYNNVVNPRFGDI